jgi:hypothetical protein
MFNMNFVVLCCGLVVSVVLFCVECVIVGRQMKTLLRRYVLVFLVWFG